MFWVNLERHGATLNTNINSFMIERLLPLNDACTIVFVKLGQVFVHSPHTLQWSTIIIDSHKQLSSFEWLNGTALHGNGESPAIWDHHVTWHPMWVNAPHPERLLLNLAALEGWKAELTFVGGEVPSCADSQRSSNQWPDQQLTAWPNKPKWDQHWATIYFQLLPIIQHICELSHLPFCNCQWYYYCYYNY